MIHPQVDWLETVQCGICWKLLPNFFAGLAHLHDAHNVIAKLYPNEMDDPNKPGFPVKVKNL